MKIKKIGEKSVKVLVESIDIERYGITLDALADETGESDLFLYALLNRIERETGIVFSPETLSVEITPAVGDNFFITLCSEPQAGADDLDYAQDEIPIVLRAERLEEICALRTVFALHPQLIPGTGELYFFAGFYFALFYFSAEKSKAFYQMLLQMEEYCTRIPYFFEVESLLRERGKLVNSEIFEKILNNSVLVADTKGE